MKHRAPFLVPVFLFLSQAACLDVVEPAAAQTAELQSIQALLRQVMDRLDTLEARAARRSQDELVRLDTLDARAGRRSVEVLANLDTLSEAVGVPGDSGTLSQVVDQLDTLVKYVTRPPEIASAAAQLEAQICFERSRGLTGEAESKVQVDGQGKGTLGVDAYGNGATGIVAGTARQVVQVKPKAQWDFKGSICGKLNGELSTGAPPQQLARALQGAPADLGALRGVLEGMLSSVSGDALSSVASAVEMTGARMSSALAAVPGLAMSQFAFGQGSAAGLINTLPLPSDLATLLQDPSSLLARAVEAGQYAIDRLCGQTMFTGDFAARAQSACDLRNDLSVDQVVNIFQGLDGLPTTVSALGSNLTTLTGNLTTFGSRLTSVCSGFNTIRTKTLTIPSHTVTFPLGIGAVQVFPGYSQPLFPGVAQVCQ